MSNQYHSGPWTGFRTQYDQALQKSICSTCDMPVIKYKNPTQHLPKGPNKPAPVNKKKEKFSYEDDLNPPPRHIPCSPNPGNCLQGNQYCRQVTGDPSSICTRALGGSCQCG